MAIIAKLYEPIDLEINLDASKIKNPFYVKLKGVVRGLNGITKEIIGFYKAQNTWCVRFSPTCEGIWEVLIISDQAGLSGKQFQINAIKQPNSNIHGVLKLDPKQFNRFVYEDGTPYYLFGYEMNWLWAVDQTSENTKSLESLVDGVSEGKFNHILINSYAYDTTWANGRTSAEDLGPPPIMPWEGLHGSHDYSLLNLGYWHHFDRMMKVLMDRGMVAHIYFKVYNKLVQWPEKFSVEEQLWFDYIVARYQGFPNVVWDFAKESYYEFDKDYILERMKRVKALDGYNHLITIHDDKVTFYTEPWSNIIDFFTDQMHFDLYHTALRQRMHNKPVFNSEFCYEHTSISKTTWTWGWNQTPEECVSRAYEVAMAGAYIGHYYCSHAWDVIRVEDTPRTSMAFSAMYDFLTEIKWIDLIPDPELSDRGTRTLRGSNGETIAFYCPNKSRARFYPAEMGTKWEGFWMDIWTGERKNASFEMKGITLLQLPFGDDNPTVGFFRRCLDV